MFSVPSPLTLLFGFGDLEWAIFLVSMILIGFLLFGFWKAFQSHRVKPTTGREGLIGTLGVAIKDFDPEGQVELRGEIWKAVAEEGEIESGSKVIVIGETGLTLKVRAVRPHDLEK
jgi:membrane-bound serine protease (ClpP class)